MSYSKPREGGWWLVGGEGGSGLRVCTALHCQELSLVIPLSGGYTNTLRTPRSGRLLPPVSEIKVIVHVREGDGRWQDVHFHFHPAASNQAFNLASFYFHFVVIKKRHHVICSRQPYHLDWQQKKRRHQQSFRMQVTHSMAPSLIIDGVCGQSYSEPRWERTYLEVACSLRAAALQQQQGKRPSRCA